MLADIASGNTGFADIMFLVAMILFLVAAIFDVRGGTIVEGRPGYGILVALGLACVALGWLVL